MFEKGDVLHWWHEHNSAGIRTYFSDDYLWLPYVLSEYISKTKDYSVLEEKTKYLEDKLMGNRRELYDVYHNINVEDSVYNHAKKTITYGLSRKNPSNGLLDIGDGDWNDGFSNIRGQSVWLTFFMMNVLDRFSSIAKYMKDNDNIENSFKFINTGTIDRYNILWGVYETQYIKDKYKYPTIKKDIIKKKFPKRYSIAIKEKIISAGMVKRLEFCYDNSANILSGKSTTVILNKEENLYNLKYIIALLNSKLYNLVFKSSNKHNAMSGGYMNVNKNSLSQFIYYPLDFNNKKDKEVHDKLVKLVDNIIAINKKLVGENNPNTKEILERQVRALDGEIDKLVYGLYGLSDNEIRIIENVS